MKFLEILGNIAKRAQTVAPAVIPAVSPAAGAITQLVLNAVVKTEQAGGDGPAKKERVMAEVAPTVIPLLTTLLKASGKNVNFDAQGVSAALAQIVEGVVMLLKAIDVPTTATAST
jgi:hypothetical protein